MGDGGRIRHPITRGNAGNRIELQHNRCQLRGILFCAVICLADVIVLEKPAAEVAIGDEDGAEPAPAR
jgi:hypothetical protein